MLYIQAVRSLNWTVQTGLRSIEINRANIGDLQQRDGYWILMVQGKGYSFKDDFVIITPSALKPIQEYLAIRPSATPKEPLFASISDRNEGGRLTTRSISRICKEAMRSNGIDSKRLSCHSLRHSACTFALLGGSDMSTVRLMSRHLDEKTLQLYTHHIDRIRNAPENSIDNILGKIA